MDPNFKKRSEPETDRILAEIWLGLDPVNMERLCFPPSASFSFIYLDYSGLNIIYIKLVKRNRLIKL